MPLSKFLVFYFILRSCNFIVAFENDFSLSHSLNFFTKLKILLLEIGAQCSKFLTNWENYYKFMLCSQRASVSQPNTICKSPLAIITLVSLGN